MGLVRRYSECYNALMITTDYSHGDLFPILRAETELGTLEVCSYGAHVLGWTPRGQKPVFYMSGTAVYAPGKALRGGIPVCWPWFGKHPADAQSNPSHGIARISPWQLVCSDEAEDGSVRLIYELQRPGFPMARYTVQMGELFFSASLQTLDAPEPMPFSAALHSYFAVSNYRQVELSGLENIPFTEFAEDAVPHSENPLVPAGHIDRIYHPLPEENVLRLKDPGYGRTLQITRRGSHSCVVWNPGHEAAVTMTDIEPGTDDQFLAVETAAVPAERLNLLRGQSHELAMRINLLPASHS